MKRIIGTIGLFVLAIMLAMPLTMLAADWYTSDGQRFATKEAAAKHAWDLKDGLKFDDGLTADKLPIGDQVTLTVVYGTDARSAALKQAFNLNPLAPARKQMRYEAYENGGEGEWRTWASKRELPALIVQYDGEEVLVRSGREITDYRKLADELAMGYAQCFHGRRGSGGSPPPDTGDDTPPPLPPTAPPPISDSSSVSVGPTGLTITFGAFALGCLVAGLVGFVRRTRGAD